MDSTSPVVGECRMDRMAKIELEAAEALAGLAYSGMADPVTELVKVESPAPHSWLDPVDSVSNSETQVNLVQKPTEKICNYTAKPTESEQSIELKLNPTYSTSYASSSSARKSRHNLTESEKEARKLRRVLANRESARQTIRRRQAIYEELTRKAADLTWENENLKKENEVASKEYDALKSKNEYLKAQMIKIVKVEEEEIREESKPSHIEKSACSSTNSPFFICNQPQFYPFLWPSLIQPTNSVSLQCGPQNSIVFPSHVSMSATGNPNSSSFEEGNSMINSAGSPVYVLSCPWLFTLPTNGSGNQNHPGSFNLNDKPNEISPSNQHTASSSLKSVVHIENQNHHSPKKIKAEMHIPEAIHRTNNLEENPYRVPPDGGGGTQHIGSLPRGTVLMPTPLSCVKSEVVVEHESTISNAKAISPAVGDVINSVTETQQDQVVCSGKKFGDVAAAAAAEARKRRKQLTKLKNLHCRQFRMH